MYPDGLDLLVVDNDAARRRQIEHILAAEGFSVTGAAEGLAALRLVRERRFALLLAATALPGSLDGAETARQARARQPWLRTLFIGAADAWPRRGSRDCDDFIAAPFHPSELLGCVFELLHREPALTGLDPARRYHAQLRAS